MLNDVGGQHSTTGGCQCFIQSITSLLVHCEHSMQRVVPKQHSKKSVVETTMQNFSANTRQSIHQNETWKSNKTIHLVSLLQIHLAFSLQIHLASSLQILERVCKGGCWRRKQVGLVGGLQRPSTQVAAEGPDNW